MDIVVGEHSLTGLSTINVLLGKNGCGKSRLLKQTEAAVMSDSATYGKTRYITPERGGTLIYQANVEQNMNSSPTWVRDTRLVNQFIQFKEQSVTQFRKLETLIHRDFEQRKVASDFQSYVDRINTLLENVEVRRDDITFKIFDRLAGGEIPPKDISSGESELVSLAIECLVFASERTNGKANLLFLDEPDVHLHPDLQARLMTFLKELVAEGDITLVIATHSTALLGELSDYSDARVAFMRARQTAVSFHQIDDAHRDVLPVFGAHPLSNVFNQAPLLLLEGDDDVRIWQQAVRSSRGAVKVYPVACGTVDAIHAYEAKVREIIEAVYDDARAFSLRDRDDGPEEIDDEPPIVRMRLSCRAAENLLLSDEVLIGAGTAWPDAVSALDAWLVRNPDHSRAARMLEFKESSYERKSFDLKELRVLLVDLVLDSNKPWEVLVGTAIAGIAGTPVPGSVPAGSIYDFLGAKAVKHLF